MGARKQEDKNRVKKMIGSNALKGVGAREDKTGKEKGCERRRNDKF